MVLSDQLAVLIHRYNINVGDRLPAERKLCELLNTSRPRLRELLKQLSSKGIIQSKVGSGNFLIKPPLLWSVDSQLSHVDRLIQEDPDYRFDVQEARSVLEGGAVWYAALRATDQDKQRIHQAYQALLTYQGNNDAEKAADADAQFHLTIAEASHNVVLIQMMRNVFSLLHHNVVLGRKKMYNDPKRAEQLNRQHAAMLTAIDKKKPQAALAAVRHHIEYVVTEVKKIDEVDARHRRKNRFI